MEVTEAIRFTEWLIENYEQVGQIGFIESDEYLCDNQKTLRTPEEMYLIFKTSTL